MKYFLLFSVILSSFLLRAQESYPKTYFDNPLKIPVVVSGTFGELRSNHFHSGIDLKTNGEEGLPIYAPADGYVHRIKVKQYGYGKALYIKHPNGYSTVYAHLSRYNKDIDLYVKEVQYTKERYSFDISSLSPNIFPIKKGEIIGYTGDTGSSGGPHLHYEIRDSKTQHIINPMHFGLDALDTRAPIFKRLMVYPLNDFSRVNNSATRAALSIKKIKDLGYISNRITASGKIGLSVEVFDQQDLANNHNGIYSLEMKVNGQRVYYHDVETFSFTESKYINLLIDFEYFSKHKKRLQKTYKDENNALSIYEDLIDNGTLFIKPNQNYNIQIIAKDFKNNSTILTVPIKGVESNIAFVNKDTTAYKITRNEFSKFKEKNVTIAFPKQSVYKDAFINFDVSNDTAYVHKPMIPLHKSYTLSFDISHLTPKERDKVYIANVTKRHPYFVSSRKKSTKIFTTTKNLGTYTLKFDKKKPHVSLINFRNKKWISRLEKLIVKIRDKESGIKSYRATIDDEWILMEYNHKKGLLTYNFSDKKLVGTKHLFKIVVSDKVGNTKTVSATFFRKDNIN